MIAYGITCVGLEALVFAELRASLGLAAAPCLAKRVGNRAGVNGGTSSGLVGALGGDEAREGRDGDDSGGVEHVVCEGWRSGVARQQVFCEGTDRPCSGRVVCDVRANAGWLDVCLPGCLWREEEEWGINGRSATSSR
jgi:hypothetical protein